MKTKEFFLAGLILLLTTCVFFYKTVLFASLPFPGDLLVSEYAPFKAYSYNGYGPGGVPSKAQYFDAIRQIYPWRTFSIDVVKQGILPLWNPYNFSGAPLLANSQSAVLYPLNFLYFFLPKDASWSVLVFLQPFLSSLFTYLYARKIGMSVFAGLLSALCFGFSLFLSVFLEYNTIGHVILWFPLLLYLLESMLAREIPFKTIAFALSITMLFLAGHLQVAGLSFGFTLLYALWRINSIKPEIVKTLRYLLVFLLGIGISGIQLLPTAELSSLAARVPHERGFLTQNLLFQPEQLLLFFAPDSFGNPAYRNYSLDASYPTKAVFIGSIPLFFALLSFLIKKRDSFVKLFYVLALFSFLLFFRSPLTQFLYTLRFLSSSSPSNGIFLLSFCLSILAGFGFMAVERKNISFRRGIVLFVAIFTLAFGFAYLLGSAMQLKNVLLSVGFFTLFFVGFFAANRVKKEKLAFSFLFFVVALELFYYFQKFNPFVPQNLIYPETAVFTWLQQHAGENRFLGVGSATIEANLETQYHLFSPNGYDPLYPRSYGEFIQSARTGKLTQSFTSRTRSDAVIPTDLSGNELRFSETSEKVINLLSVKYVVVPHDITFPEAFRMVYTNGSWSILENTRALPRAFFPKDIKIYSSVKEFEQIFFSTDLDPGQSVFLEKKLPLTPTNNKLLSISIAPNVRSYDVSMGGNGVLFMSDTYYPGWKASIDGKKTKLLRADYTFQAVAVPKGDHRVTLYFQPESFSSGVKLSIISLGVLIGCSFVGFRHKRYAKENL